MPLRFGSCSLVAACLLLALVPVRVSAQEISAEARPLTPEQGQAIIKATLRYGQTRAGRKSDCSHLVHEVYTLAGYAYPYASSFELYAGVPDFVRVRKPQPGDLVVWRGHVGIVIDSEEHTFYSSLRSGLRTDDYDLPHWKARGRARFYRYLTDKPAGTLVAGNRAAPGSKAQASSADPVPVANASAARDDDDAEPIGSNAKLAGSASVRQSADALSSSVLIFAVQEEPTEVEILDAISELNNAVPCLKSPDC